MAKFRKLHLATDGTEVWVNFDLVTSIVGKKERTTLTFEKGHNIVVREKTGDLKGAPRLTIGEVKS
ncbi:hypothetical protein [Bradyrhizobium denitrificans]|uniref:hypothetical protein n=1 Tax=Bradyrhizobium denitrificans TaxID=2734912 RepID=UPI001557CC74|nr:hypothetical protein [Bradyrhizobium sp. LMG 8443]NPU23957.1 hypothetical protein [Bradyrhizobium sp. LMG 8443]